MQSKNTKTQGLLTEMSSKKIRAPQVERISSLDSGRPPVMIFTSRGKVARKSLNSRVFETFDESSLTGGLESRKLNTKFDYENTGNNRHVNGKITANGVNSGSYLSSTETHTKRRPAPAVPVTKKTAPGIGNSLVSSRELSLSSSLHSLNNRLPLESDNKVRPPLIPPPKSFLQRQSPLSSSTSSLSSLHLSPTSQLQQSPMTQRQYTSDLSLPPPPPDANNNEETFQASVTNEEYQQISHLTTAKTTRAPEPPTIPSPPPPPSPPSHTPPHSPLPSQSSTHSSSSASSSPLNRFRFPPPPTTPPSPMEINEMHTSFTNTSVSSALSPPQVHSDRERKSTLSANEVMDYFDEAIGDQVVSASSYNDTSSHPAFSPVFHFPSVSDDKELKQMSAAIEPSTQKSRDVGHKMESNETATNISTVSYSKNRNDEESYYIHQTEFSYSENKTSEENSTQNLDDNSLLSPNSEEERKRKGNAASKSVAVSKLRPEVKTVRQYIKPGIVDELANLFSNINSEQITSPSNKNEFDFNFRETLEKLESVDKRAESKSPVMRNAKRSSILSPSELFPRLQSSVSAESLHGRPQSLHTPAYSKVNQWPRLYQASSANTLYTPPALDETASTPGFDFLAASREIHKHVVLIRSNSRAGVTATNKVNELKRDSSQVDDSVSNIVNNAPIIRSKSPVNTQERNNQFTEETVETYNRVEENLVTATASPVTEIRRTDISRIDSPLTTSEMLTDEAHYFPTTTERQDTSEFPHPTITPTNSRNSSRRSSLEDNTKSEIEHLSASVPLNEAVSSRGSSRSNSPTRPTSSQSSSRRSSLRDKENKEDTSNYSAGVDLERTLSSVVTRPSTSSRSSSRSNSPERKSDMDTTHALTTAATSSISRRSSSRSNSMKSENNTEIKLHKLHSRSGSSASTSPANSRSSSRAGSVRRSGDVDEDYKSLDVENALASKVAASFSPNNDTHIEKDDVLDRKVTLDHHSNASLDGLSSYTENISSYNSSNFQFEHRTTDSQTEISEDHINTKVVTNTSAHSSRSGSRSGSMKIRDNKEEVNLELPHSTADIFVGAVSNTGSSSSSRSSSPEKRSTEDTQTTVHTVDNVFSKRDSISSNSSRSSQAESEKISSRKPISSYENVILFDSTSLAGSRKSLPDSLHNRSHESEVSLELPSSFVGIEAVKSGAVSAPSHTSSKNSSRSHSPDRDIGSEYFLHSSNSPMNNGTSIISTPERSRRSSQADEVRLYSDQTTKEHHEQVTTGSISSRGSSQSGSFKIRDNKNEVHLDFPSRTVETVDIDTTAVYATKPTRSRSSSGSTSPHKENSEDIIQSFDKEFVNKRSTISSSPDSSRKSSLVGVPAGDSESATNIETNLTPLHSTRTDWTNFLQKDTKSEEDSTAVFNDDLENKHATSTHISPSSSKSSSREGSPERNKTHDHKSVDLKTAASTPSSTRSSSLAGSVRNKASGMESDSYKAALENSLGFTVISTAGSSSSESRSSSVNRDDSQQNYINDENEASDKHALSSTTFYSDNKKDDGKEELDYKLLMDKYATESVTSTSSNWWDSFSKNETSEITQKESHGMDLKNSISSSRSPAGSERSSRKNSPERNKPAVEHSQIVENIATSTFTAAQSPAHSRTSSPANPVTDIYERNEQNEAHAFFKRSVSSSNSPASSRRSSRRSSSSLDGASTKANQQLHDDTIYANIGKLEDTDTVKDSRSEIKIQSPEEIPHSSASIFNSANYSTRISPVSSRRSSQTNGLHNGGSENQKDETVSLASKSSSSSATTTPAGQQASHDANSVKDTGLYTINFPSDLATRGNTDAGSVTDMYVRTRSRDSSPGGSVERKTTWNDKETDSYQLALQSALESTRMISTTADGRQDRQVGLVKRDSQTSHSSSNNSKSSSRSGSPSRNRISDFQADHFNVTLERTLATPTVSNDVTNTGFTSDITSVTFTQSEQEEGGAYSLPSTENLSKETTFEEKNDTLKDDAAVYGFSDTKAILDTHSETHVNTAEGKHFNTYYTEVGSKLLGDAELKDTYNFETRLPPTDGELLTSNLGSNVNFSEKESMTSVDSGFHLARFGSNNVDHSEVSQSMNTERVDRSSFSASMDVYSQPHVANDRDEVTSVTYENKDDSSDDDKPLLKIDDKPGVEYVKTVVDIHVQDKEDTLSQLSTTSQFGSDKDVVVDILDNRSVSSDSDSSSHKNRQAEYTLNETPDEDSSVYTVKTTTYSFNDFKEGIAHTSSNQLSSLHDKQEGSVPEVDPTSYETDSAVLPAFSQKDTTRGSRKSSSSTASDIDSSYGEGRPVLETSFKNEEEHGVFQKMGKTNTLTRQEHVISQLSEDAHGQTGESFSFLMADQSNVVLHQEIGSGVIHEKENANITESKSTKDTEEISSIVMQLQADEQSSPTVLDLETSGLYEGAQETVIPVADHSMTSQPKDFLSVLDDINIDTDITSRFLRRSSRFSGTTSPVKRQSHEGKSVPDDNTVQTNAEVVHDPMTEATLSRTALILTDYQAKETALTTETGNPDLARGFSVGKDVINTDISFSDFAGEQKERAVDDIDVNHSESLRTTFKDEMHKASHDLVQRKYLNTDLNINYDTNADDMVRKNSVNEIMYSSVRNTKEGQLDLFRFLAETGAAASRDDDIGLESHHAHEVKTGMTEADYFETKSESIHVNDNLSSLAGEVVVDTNYKEDQTFALREDNGLLNEYVNNIVYQAAAKETDAGQTDLDVREDKDQVDSYVHDVIRHSVDTVRSEDMDKSNYFNELDVDVKEDKDQVDSYVHDVIRHSVETINTEDMDKSNYFNELDVDVKEDKDQVDSYVHDVIRHSVDTVRTEDMDKSNFFNELDFDVKEDKDQVDSYVHDVIQHSVETINTEDMDKSYYGNELDVDVRVDKDQVDSYVHDVIRHSVDTVRTEDVDRHTSDDHSSHLDIGIKNEFKEAKLTDTSLLPSNLYNSVIEMNADDNNKEGSNLAYEEIQSKELYLTNTATYGGLHISNDAPDAKGTVNEEIYPHITADLQSTNVQDAFNESREKINARAVDEDFVISEKYLGGQSRESFMNDVFRHIDDRNTETNRSEDLDINKQHEFNESAFDFLHQSHAKEHPPTSLQYEDVTARKYILGRREESTEHQIREVTGDQIESSVREFNIAASGSGDIHTEIMTQSEKAYVHAEPPTFDIDHFREENNEENNIEFDEALHDNIKKESIYVNNSTTAPFEVHIRDHSEAEIEDIHTEIMTQSEKAYVHAVPPDHFLEENNEENNNESDRAFYEDMKKESIYVKTSTAAPFEIDRRGHSEAATEDIHTEIMTQSEKAYVHAEPPAFDIDHFGEENNEENNIEFDEALHENIKKESIYVKNSTTAPFEVHKRDHAEAETEDIHTEIMTQSEKAYVHAEPPDHFLEENNEENKIEFQEALHENIKKESIYVKNSTTAPFEVHKRDHAEAETEDIHTEIMTQSEKAYVHAEPPDHFLEENNEENNIELDEVLHENKNKESIYVNNYTAAPFEAHKRHHSEIDLDEEIRKQHLILSPKLTDEADYDEALNFNPDTSRRSSRSSVGSVHSYQIQNHHHTTRETAFNSEFFVRSHSSSDDGKQDLSRQNSVSVTAGSSLFLHQNNDNNSPAELLHKEHTETVDEFNRVLDINSEHSTSSRSSVSSIDSDRNQHHTVVTSNSFGLGEAIPTETHGLPSTKSLLEADKSSRSNIKNEYERLNLEVESTDFGSAKASPYSNVVGSSFDSFGFQAQPESNAHEIGADLNQTTVSVAQLAQTLRSTSNDEESTKQKEDESHLFSRDKFQALRNVFEKQQETMPESSSFKIKQNSYKPGLDPSSVSESKHAGNWELNRQVSSGSSIISNDKKEIRGHLTSAAQIEDYTSFDSDSDRGMTKWNEPDKDTNPDIQNQVHKKTVLTKKLSYDLQSRELRRGSTSSASSASSVGSTKHAEMDIRSSDHQGEAYSSTFRSDDHYPKNSLFSQKPGLMNLAQWSTQPTIGNESESVLAKRKSSVSSDSSTESQKEVARPTSGDFHKSTSKETYNELHSPRETHQNQLHDVVGEVSNPLFDDSSSTVEEEVGFRNRTNSTSSHGSNRSSSLEIEDHSLFSQETVGSFPPSNDHVAANMQTSFVRETASVNSDKSSVKSQSDKRSSLGDVNTSYNNFSFRENNLMKTNTTEFLAGNVKAQVGQQFVSQSLDRSAAVRRHSSSGSEKEAKLIGAFLRSNVRAGAAHDMSSSHISRQSSEIGSEKSHQSTQPDRSADVTDTVHGNRRVSSSSDSSDSGKEDIPRRAASIHSETSFTEAKKNTLRNYEDLTSTTDHNTQNHKFQSEEAFTVVSHNFSQPDFRRDSLTSQGDRNQAHIYRTPEDQNESRSLQENGRSPINVDERPTVKTYVIKRSIASDVFEKLDDQLGETVVINRGLGSTENSPGDFYTNSSTVPETTTSEVTDIYSQTQESIRQRHLQSSPLNIDSFNHGITLNKENFSLENARSYRDRFDSHSAHDNGGTRLEIKRPGLDNSPIFPSLFNRDTSVPQTYRYTGIRHDMEKSSSAGVNSATIHRNQHTPIDDRFQFTPITISTVSQAVVGDTVGVNIDFSPHSPHDISFSSDEDSNQQRFIVKNVQQTSVLKNSHNNSISDIFFPKEEVAAEDVNKIINNSGTLSPRTVVDGPIFSSSKSQRSHLSRSFSSDNSLGSLREYNNDSGPKGYDITLTNNDHNDHSGNLYRVLSVSPNGGPEFKNTEAERGRSRNRSNDFSDTINNSKTPRKQHHSPERFFKNPKLSLRQEDYDSKGYSSDDEDGKHYHHVTKVYLSGESPRSRSQSPNTSFRVSSLKTQNTLEKDNDRRNGVSEARSSNNLGNRSPDSSDNDSHSGFQEHQPRYKVVGTLDSSLDKHLVRAQSSPKLDRKHENYYQETTITRTQAAPPQPSNVSAAKQTHKSVVQLEVGSNYITEKRDPEDDPNSRYMIKRVRSADDLRDGILTVDEEDQNSSDRKMWKTGRSRSTDRYLNHGDSVYGARESIGKYDLPSTFMTTANTRVDNDKMYVVNSTSSRPKDNHEHDSTAHGWYTSTADFNDRSPKRAQNRNQSYHEDIHSPNYKTEKTVYISNKASPRPNAGNVHERTKEFVFHDYGQGTEIANSLLGNEYPPNEQHFERINEDITDPHNLDYSRSTEDLSNDLRVLRGKILIKNRFDNSEFSEDDIDQNANLFDTSFHLGKDNPVYSSDPDIAASLRREAERDLSKLVTQDVTFETVDSLAHQYKGDRQVQLSPGPQRKKPNLSSLLLSKLALVDSKDIRQTVDVEHHNEEIHGDIRFVHADGEQKESKDTYNFDSVNEKVELTLTQGKANVIIKVIAERVIPTNTEFNTWRKSQAIVTRHIEINLQANEQMKRLYKHVMTKSGKSGSLEGSSRLSSYNSASLSPQERDLNSMETLQLFTQILDIAEQQSSRDHTDSGVRHELGQIPASVMDMLY